MRSWKRPAEPKELRSRKAALTQSFIASCERHGVTPSCDWPVLRLKDGSEERLHDYLARSTARHCSYCDSVMTYAARETIDHFFPKSDPEFRHLSYEWKNLYLACDPCQSEKKTKVSQTALRPDQKDYEFARYFRYKQDGTIVVIASTPRDRRRAEETVRLFGLDNPKLTGFRRREFEKRLKQRPMMQDALDDCPYRDWPGWMT